jgi:hypothetical protein
MRLKRLFPVILIAFILNLIWEFCHYRLYFDMTGIPQVPHIILASFVDVILISLIFIVVSFKNKKPNWIICPKEKDYFFVILSGLVIAFFWELINLQLGRWTYKFTMPLFFGVGLSPLLQLAITSVLSLCVYNCLTSKCS